jgi:hypothetical protein
MNYPQLVCTFLSVQFVFVFVFLLLVAVVVSVVVAPLWAADGSGDGEHAKRVRGLAKSKEPGIDNAESRLGIKREAFPGELTGQRS